MTLSEDQLTETDSEPAEEAVQLAEELLRSALRQTSFAEAARMKRVNGMIDDPAAKNLSLLMTDRLGRSDDYPRVARSWRRLLDRFELGDGFSLGDRCLLKLAAFASRFFPGLVMKSIRKRLRNESRGVILPAESHLLKSYLSSRRKTGARVNVNQLGEAVLGEKEAALRLKTLLNLLKRDDINYVSVKVSAIFSQINLVAWEDSLFQIKDRLRRLYRRAKSKKKFINLDMEEYRDLELTVRAFREVLSEKEFLGLSAGIVLQAYLPDSITAQRELTEWAKLRVEQGGAPIKIRLVKGANLAMEKVEAEWHDWPAAPHPDKHTTDAAFKRMLEFACHPENAPAVHLGVGSHNLFDIALALVFREKYGVTDFVDIEMLEGMAPAQARVVQEKSGSLLLYSPIVNKEDYESALAYLIRRLDENTARGNFLASLFSLEPGSDAWNEQKEMFLAAWKARKEVNETPHRSRPKKYPKVEFHNAPDSDWTQPETRARLDRATILETKPPQAGESVIDNALDQSVRVQKSGGTIPEKDRVDLLRDCAAQLEKTRFESIALLRREAMKAPAEADAEVSEAIDFANYYAETGETPEGTTSTPLGTVVVASPWNFPFAIPCGGVLAALMAGNAVILKPAPETALIGWWLARQLWEAGVPRDVLQFIACEDGEVGKKLIVDSRTSAVILTGAYETARRFQTWKPSLKLFAETSGKNALLISAMADRELAAKDLVKSAFGHSGQKCSAASLAILESEVYEDETFLRQLKDAAFSLAVGRATDSRSLITPLVQEPNGDLLRALTTLETGEEWLLKPRVAPDDPCLWTPGIKMGVRPDSWFHQTECFGPVLGLMEASGLDEAIAIQNSGMFGLTAGIHTLDDDEIAYWKQRVEAGNLYVNRSITGAIVRRQPFGGWKRSSIGLGAKAGGPNYVNLFRNLRDKESVDPESYIESYQEAFETCFCREHDPTGLKCESNVFRYRPRKGILLRLKTPDVQAVEMASHAAEVTGINLVISMGTVESDSELMTRLPELAGEIDLLRTIHGAASDELMNAAANLEIDWHNAPVTSDGRIELSRWFREQSVSETLHRYGNITSFPAPNSRIL